MTPRLADHADSRGIPAPVDEAEAIVASIRCGEVDALVVESTTGRQVYTLHSADEPYRILVEQMPEGAVVLTAQGTVVYANARFAALVGEPLELLPGSRLDRFVPQASVADFTALLAEGNGRSRMRLLAGTGAPIEVSLSVSTTASPSGDHLNIIVSDLTELLEAREDRDRAQRDNRAKDEFLAVLAHELRSPLGAISAATGVLRFAPPGGSIKAQAVIRRQVAHISHLITDLLDVERMVAGKLRLDRSRLDLGAVMRRDLETLTGDTRFDWRVEIEAAPIWIEADGERITQILNNLVTNAVKYTPAGGRISVSARADGDSAVVTVGDSGFGISARLLPNVFDLYTQADRTLDRSQGGLGIGLTLVRRLVELHDGSVTVASDGENCGSVFTIRLNLMPAAPLRASADPLAHDRRDVAMFDVGGMVQGSHL